MTTQNKEYDLVGNIISYECGDLSDLGMLELFSHLIKSGECWSLQGHYGRTASALIEGGYITRQGKITSKYQDKLDEGE